MTRFVMLGGALLVAASQAGAQSIPNVGAAKRAAQTAANATDRHTATMTADQASKPIAPSHFRFARHGHSGLELSEMLPYTAQVADELCLIRSLRTEAINHDPGMTQLLTGVPFSG